MTLRIIIVRDATRRATAKCDSVRCRCLCQKFAAACDWPQLILPSRREKLIAIICFNVIRVIPCEARINENRRATTKETCRRTEFYPSDLEIPMWILPTNFILRFSGLFDREQCDEYSEMRCNIPHRDVTHTCLKILFPPPIFYLVCNEERWTGRRKST